MKYTAQEVIQYVQEEDVKFIRLAFCDVYGRQKNLSIMPGQLRRAFEDGMAFDASAIAGFGGAVRSDLFLRPDPATLAGLPWRPENGAVVRMFCDVIRPDGAPFAADTRRLLRSAVETARTAGYDFSFGPEMEFYLFKTDETGAPTTEPFDRAGYMDISPADRGENVRREICLTLERMGIFPESSHHEEGPGQNEIDFRYSDALTAADNVMTFQTVVKTIARRNGLWADFSAKPLENQPGNGFHINISVKPSENSENLCYMIAGILDKAEEMTAFLNPTENSYRRFGRNKAPGYVSWSSENRSQLVRIPAAVGEYRRAELRSPDPTANPYLAFALMIYAGVYGLENRLDLPEPANFNLYKAKDEALQSFQKLPGDLYEACKAAAASDFIRAHVPDAILEIYCNRG